MASIVCPICHRENTGNASFCIFCGAPIETAPKRKSTTRQIEFDSEAFNKSMNEAILETFKTPEHGIALYLAEQVAPIATCDEQAFVIGRKMTDIKTDKFVDLTAHGAYENGVSTRHAMIRKKGSGYEVIDLGSTNGTILNEHTLRPNIAYALPAAAQLRLGKLSIYTLYSIDAAPEDPKP